MFLEHNGKSPKDDQTARIASNATICGDVTVGPNCSVGFGAVITAESGPVSIGEKYRDHGYRSDTGCSQ